MTDGVLDVVLLVLTLAVVTGVAFMVVVPLSKPYVMDYESSIQDKSVLTHIQDENVRVTGGEVPKPIKYSAEGVILATQVQDTTLPSPKKLRIGVSGKEVEVGSMYTLELLLVANEVWASLPSKTGEYTIDYTYRNGKAYQITRE